MPVYLDHAATSPLRPEVRSAYVDALGVTGNPSSVHGAGRAAKALLEEGRERVAAAFGAEPVEVVLTGGGTESVNLGVKGLYWAARESSGGARRRIVVPRGEHHATIDSVEWLAAHDGAVLDWIELDALGRVRLDLLEAALAEPDDVALVTMLWASNEVGTVQPVDAAVALARAAGVPVHLDAVAAAGQAPVSLAASGAQAISLSAHKLGAPVGIGALLVSRSAGIEPLLHGGAQQRARSGTMDAAGAFAFAFAAELAALDDHAAWAAERDRLIDGVLASVPGATLRGAAGAGRLPGNAHLTFEGCDGDSLLFLLDAVGIRVSTGSACAAGVAEPSHVLLAMGLDERAARGAVRCTLGWSTTPADVDALLDALPEAVARARAAGLA